MILLLALVVAIAFACFVVVTTLPLAQQRPVVPVLLLCASFPLGLQSVGFSLKLVQLAVLVVVAIVAFLRLSSGGPPLGWTKILWLPVAIVVLAVLSTPGSIDPALSEKQDIIFVLGLLLICCVVGAVRTMSDVRMILLGLLVAGDVICLTAVVGAGTFTVQFSGAVVNNRVHGIFTQPNDFGSFSAAVLCIAMGLALTQRQRGVRVVAGVSTAIAAAAVAVSLSRGAMIGVGLAVIGFAVLLPRIRWRVVGITGIAVGCLAVSSAAHIGPTQVQVLGARLTSAFSGNDNPNDARTAAWHEALREIGVRPLLGFGPNGFPEASAGANGIGSAGNDFSVNRALGIDHAHNVLLTVAAELGLVAASAVVAFSLALGLRLLRTIRTTSSPDDAGIAIACAGGLLSFVGHGLVDYTLRDAMILIPLCLITGCAVAATFARSGPDRPDPSRAVGVAGEPVAAAATGFEQ